jgi:O-antigen ligase
MIRLLFIFAIAAFVSGQMARFQLANGIHVSLLDCVVGLIAITWWGRQLIQKKRIHALYTKALFVFLAVCFVSLIINTLSLSVNQLLVAFLYLLRFVAYGSLYFIAKSFTRDEKNEIMMYLLAAGVISLILGFVQFLFFDDLRSMSVFGWDIHLYRLFGMYLDPNFAGVIYCLFLILLVAFMVNSLQKNENRYHQILVAILIAATILAIVLTYSRTALVMMVTSFLAFAGITWQKKLFIPLGIVSLILVVAFSNIFVEGKNPFRVASSSERVKSMQEAMLIIQRHPVLGVGFNAYRYAQNRYNLRRSDKWEVSHADAGTDNSFLFVFATTGIVGLTAFGYLWYSIISSLYKKIKKHSDQYGIVAASLVSTVSLLMSSMFLNVLFYPYVLFWLWSLYGLTEE